MEHMTSSAPSLRNYRTISTNDGMDTADGKLLPITRFDWLHLRVNQDSGDLTGTMKDLELRRVAHVPHMGNRSLLSVTLLSKSLHPHLHMYAVGSTINPPQGTRSLTFRKLHPASDLCEIMVWRRPASPKPDNGSPPKLNEAGREGRGGGYKHAPSLRMFTPTMLDTSAEYPCEEETELAPNVSEQEEVQRPNTKITTPTTPAVREMANYQTGEIPPIPPRPVRGGEIIVLLTSAMNAQAADMEARNAENVMAKEAEANVTSPRELPKEPTTLGQAQYPPLWTQGEEPCNARWRGNSFARAGDR